MKPHEIKGNQAHQHQDDRRGDADGGVGRQQTDHEGRQAHQQHGDEEGVLAPPQVAHAAEDDGPERTHREAGGEGHQGKNKRRGVVDPGKELFADHRREGAVEEEVIPLEYRPQGRGENDFP